MKTHTSTPAIRPLSLAAAAIVALGGFGLAACGGDDETDSSTTASVPTGQLSATELASTADSLCGATDEQLKSDVAAPDFGENGLQPGELEDAAPYYDASAEGQKNLFDQLSQLEPDPDLSDDWEAFLKAYDKAVVADSETLAKYAAAGDPEKFFATALHNQARLQDLAKMASALGMTVCAASDTASSENASQ